MSRRARRKEPPRKNDSRPTIPFSVPDKTSTIGLHVANIVELLFARAKTKLNVDMSLPLFTMMS